MTDQTFNCLGLQRNKRRSIGQSMEGIREGGRERVEVLTNDYMPRILPVTS